MALLPGAKLKFLPRADTQHLDAFFYTLQDLKIKLFQNFFPSRLENELAMTAHNYNHKIVIVPMCHLEEDIFTVMLDEGLKLVPSG